MGLDDSLVCATASCILGSMKNRFLLLAMSLWAISLTPLHARKVVVTYVPNWIDLAEFSKSIDYSKVTQLNIAFENPVNDVGELSFNPADAELIRRARAAGVKVLVSIDQWGLWKIHRWTRLCPEAAENAAHRRFIVWLWW